jgi:hypothetical protein
MKKILVPSKILGWGTILLLFSAVSSRTGAAPLMPGFEKSTWFDEQIHWFRLDSGVRGLIDAPATLKASRRALIVYATPNGNTLEQTLGCAAEKGRDWHFNIQHVAAQTRCYRKFNATEDVFLAVVQAPQLSWPAYRQARQQADLSIREIVETLAKQCAADKVILACHSGGGSFVFGYVNAVDSIPPIIARIILLDANYSYSDDKRHGDKLLACVRNDLARHLVIVAYDDREIADNGKKIIGPEGGTFRASQRMLARFRREVKLSESDRESFTHLEGKNDQIQFFLHRNPENKILHTALVGEMNGMLLGLTRGTKQENGWGQFGGPRAYTKWIQPQPFAEPAAPLSKAKSPAAAAVRLEMPNRPADAPTSSIIQRKIAELPRDRREAVIVDEIMTGNIPAFLRQMKPISLSSVDETGSRHHGCCYVTPDYLSVGSDEDFFRIPLTARAALKVANAFHCLLPTAKLSDVIFAAAEMKLDPSPLTKDRGSVATFFQHHQLIEEQLRGKLRGLLVAGIKKDEVLSNRLKEKPHKVAIYGWHYPDGRPIQPLFSGHRDAYVDYSHGTRLVAGEMIVDGRPMQVTKVLKDKLLCGLLSDEGPIDVQEVRKAAGWEQEEPVSQPAN